MDNYCTAYCLVFGVECPGKAEAQARAGSNPALSHMIATGQAVASLPGITPAQLAALLQLIETIASLFGA